MIEISLWYSDIKVSNSYRQYSFLNVMGWTIGLRVLPEEGSFVVMSRTNHTAYPLGNRGHNFLNRIFSWTLLE